MPVRTGGQYIAGLKDRAVEIYVSGERVKDVTTHPGMSNGVHSIARLYDLRHDGAADDQMTFASPTSGDPVGLSFVVPKTPEDLVHRRSIFSRCYCSVVYPNAAHRLTTRRGKMRSVVSCGHQLYEGNRYGFYR